ncbi:Sensor protein ZraS [Planctomycetes bacterium MalM25]|nr:Sensor protein ZraS [Planctomycetes bacterium MalM25]
MPSLFVIQGRDQGQRHTLDEPMIGVGRVGGNAIQVHDTEVSRKHAVMELSGEEYVLRDLNSSNGTFVNGKRIKEQRLLSGDQIQFGRTLLLYTGTVETHEAAESGVSIVESSGDSHDGSRILHAISQTEGSDLLATPADQTQSPWLARARSNLQLMYRTSLAVSHTLDIDQLVARILDMIFEWVDADRGCIMLKDQTTGRLSPSVRRLRRGPEGEPSPHDSDPDGPQIAISQTILDYVIGRGEGVLTSNAGDDKRWDPAGSIMQMGVREAICVPMQGRYDLVGVIYIDTSLTPKQMLEMKSANKFGQEHLKLMVAIAHQAALAIEDTHHYKARVQAERLAAMGQTIATLSHHIKNILQGVRGGSYLIELGLGEHAKALTDGADAEAAAAAVQTIQKGWGIVEKNQDRISSLVMDMLTYSKERKPDPEPCELNDIVGDAAEMLRARAAEHGVELNWRPGEGLSTLRADPEAIHRAVMNIVTNAIDACNERDPARVDLTTSQDEASQTLRLTVADTGEGIAPDRLKTIFSAFESSKGSRGTGLGLAVTQKIAEEHGGTVTVESEVGRGSTFRLELPIAGPPAVSQDEAAKDSPAGDLP